MEIRLHGRGGQGGVTCAKIIAAVYARLGKSVQTFGDYAGERSGAPVRAYTRVDDRPIDNRNKVYRPDHVLVLDANLLDDAAVAGLADGGTLLVNTAEAAEALAARFPRFRIAAIDATAIARRHRIGTRTVVIVNTTVAGAFARAFELPLAALEETYRALGFDSNLAAAREAFAAVALREASAASTGARAPEAAALAPVPSLIEALEGAPTGLRTGDWRSQAPRWVRNLAPCSAACPAGNDVVGFVQALARDGEAAAAAVLARSTPLPAVCGRVCPAPCAGSCNRRRFDGAVDVRALERWIADHAPAAPVAIARCSSPRRFAVVGGGPAGLSAAWQLARAGHRVTLLDGERALGGVLRTGIPEYRLPRAVLDREIAAVLALGVEARLGEALDRGAVAALAEAYDAVILATGLQRLRGLDGAAALGGVEQGIRFLHRVNLGGGARLDGHVVVLGGGNTAMDCARSALRAGAARVTVAYRRGRDEMPAIAEEVAEAEREGVALLLLAQPLGFRGDGRVRAVVLADVELGPPDASGRPRPVVTDRRRELACDHVLLALGQSPDAALLPDGWRLDGGRAFRGGAALPVFAAGDFATGDGTVAHAIGDGRRAASRALHALGLSDGIFTRPDPARAVPASAIHFDRFARAPSFADSREADRCCSCGDCTRCDTCLVYCPEGIIRRTDEGYLADLAYCKGCGVCVAECPRLGMEMA